MKIISSFFLLWVILPASSQSYSLTSPDNSIKIEITTGNSVSFKISVDGKELISPTTIDLEIDKLKSGDFQVKKSTQRTVNQIVKPVVPEKALQITDNFNELRLNLKNKLSLVFRAYNQGIAYRWESAIPDSITVISEKVDAGFSAEDLCWYPLEESFYSHNERLYKNFRINQISKDKLASLPALVSHSGINVLISEADLFDYPGMWLTGTGNNQLTAVFPHHAATEKARGDRNLLVTSTDNFLAKTAGTRTFPWRVFMIARTDGELLNNQLVYLLSRETTADFSWVKPGKISWDWWNALNIDGVDFKSGVNTETYKYYIDFAAHYGLQYIILDEGWSPTMDITRSIHAVSMPELTAYAKEKNIGIILWVVWATLDKQMEQAMDIYAGWGVKGIKVDFMQRDDQKMVNFYERTAREATKRHLLVDFHGAYKPTGMERLYPNVITREGVYGMEQSKWDSTKSIGPEHNVTLPFIRNAVGPMDYTPGAMINAQKSSWRPIFERPMSLGTRCHQLAMYVVFTSPLQMLADAPSNYYREPECMEFLKQVPAVWAETRALNAKTGDYVAIARKAENGDWYIGAMTDWTARDLTLDLSFLGKGEFSMDIWQDGVNANRNANDFAKKTAQIPPDAKFKIHLAPGGGWAAIIHAR
jgi:alpha-glucosidase